MKKVFLLAALLVASMSMMAEEPQSAMNQVVWHNGKVMYASPIPTVDSITFADDIESSDTLHLILPRTIIKEVQDTTIKEVIKEVIVEVHDTVIKKVYQCPEEPLAGVFSVAADKQVRFSKGNLQYTQSTDTWSIADNQYDFIGTDNLSGGIVSHDEQLGDFKLGDALADVIDWFGWSSYMAIAKWGISITEDYSNYSSDFVDWGQNIGDGSTWRTLNKDEWNYLFYGRTNASTKYAVACILLNDSGTEYSNGMIILPDNWSCPEGIAFESGMSAIYSIVAFGNHQTFTLEQWLQLENAGAVFLPAGGDRRGAMAGTVQLNGYYWSSSNCNTKHIYRVGFDSRWLNPQDTNDCYLGCSVRLVQDL